MYLGRFIHGDGFVTSAQPNNGFSVRPVFYLKTSTSFIGGSGTIDNPFIIL